MVTPYNVAAEYNATGGVLTTDGDYNIHTFTSSGTFTPNDDFNVSCLVVGGGGAGGGNYYGGGGGSGGLVYHSSKPVYQNPYSITVGGGGVGSINNVGGNGNNSVFSDITALGGGGGGEYLNTDGGADGGSGGGGGTSGDSGVGWSGGTGTQGNSGGGTGYGNNGGDGLYRSGGGGGGANAVGGNGDNSDAGVGGDGGDGLAYSISGSSIHYAGGGGGSVYTGTPGTGGTGGGGNGTIRTPHTPTTGTANSGGGGGGASDLGYAGANGGSGIVIIRYNRSSPPPPALNGTYLYPNSTYSIGYYGSLTSELVYETGINFSDIYTSNLLSSANMEYLSIDDTNYISSIDKDAAHDGYMYGNFSLYCVESVNFIRVKTVHNRVHTNPVILGLFNVSTQKWHAVNNSSVETVDVELTYNITGTDIIKYSTLIDNTLNLSVSLNTNGDGNYDVFVDFVEVYVDYEEVPRLTLEYVHNLTILNKNDISILQNDVDDLENNMNNLYLFVLLCTVFLVATLRKRGENNNE